MVILHGGLREFLFSNKIFLVIKKLGLAPPKELGSGSGSDANEYGRPESIRLIHMSIRG